MLLPDFVEFVFLSQRALSLGSIIADVSIQDSGSPVGLSLVVEIDLGGLYVLLT